ncbi:hypothetical protein ACLILZ_34760, partial [Mycobacterium paragordonae]
AGFSLAETAHTVLPFSWQGVSLHAAGATRLRACITAAGEDAVSIELADGAGLPVLSVESLKLRPVTTEQLQAAVAAAGGGQGGLLEVRWSPVALDGHATA